jgi:hypothetical protein
MNNMNNLKNNKPKWIPKSVFMKIDNNKNNTDTPVKENIDNNIENIITNLKKL